MKRNMKREASWAALVLLLLFLASGAALVVNQALQYSEQYFPYDVGPVLGEVSDEQDRSEVTKKLNGIVQELAQGKVYAKLVLYEGNQSNPWAMSGTYLAVSAPSAEHEYYVALDIPGSEDAVFAFLQEVRGGRDNLVSISGYRNDRIIYPTEIVYDQYTLLEEPVSPGKDVPATCERKTLKLKPHPLSEGLEFISYPTDGTIVILGSGSDVRNSYAEAYAASKQKLRHVWEALQKVEEKEAAAQKEWLSTDLSEMRLFDDSVFHNDNRQGGNLVNSVTSYVVCVREASNEQPALYLTVHAVAYPLYDAFSDLEMTLAFLFLFYLCVFIALLSNKFWKIYKQQNSAAQRQHDFTNALAHEMKTPMSVIRGYGEMLQENIAPSKEAAYLDGIVRETEHMDEMVTEILSFTRLDAESLPLHPTVFALDQMLYAQLRTFEVPMEDKKLRLLTDISEDVQVNAGVKELVLAVRNLLSNAMKYTPEGGEIRIRLERKRGKAILEIYNQGQQIPKKNLPYLWDAFYRADESRTKENRGSGMGLAVTKAILQRHRARFGVRNQTGGVCFWFALPLNRGRKGGGLI